MAEDGFRFQGCRVMLTYSHHLPKQAVMDDIVAKLGFAPKFIRCAHETADERHPYPHTHILIHFGKNFKCQNSRRLDFIHEEVVVHPNWNPVTTNTHWRNSTKYLAKEDPDNADLLDSPVSLAQTIWDCSTIQDALLRCNTVNEATGVIALYAHKPRDAPICAEPDFPWHTVAKQLVCGASDGRTIHWFCDPVGGTGKSWLTRWACVNDHAYAITTGCSIHHFATIIAGAIDSGWNQRCIIFDLPRQCEDLDRIYTLLEACCDGVVTATKYQGKTVWFNKPVVIVLANWMPNMGRMSLDRWKTYTITRDRTIAGVPATPSIEADNTLRGLTLTVAPPRPDNLDTAEAEKILTELI